MNRFKQARINAGLSQKSAAISLGVRGPSMSGWESGKTRPKLKYLKDMADLYGVSVDYLLGEDGDDKKEPAVMSDDELRNEISSRVMGLSDPALARLSDFLDGLAAGQRIAERAQAAYDPAPEAGEESL